MVMLNMEDDELESDDAYFELELGPHDEDDEFEFRVSVSAEIFHHPTTTTANTVLSAANHHAAAAPNIDLTPAPHPTHTTTSTSCRKARIGGGKMMMKLLVKLRSIVGVGGLRWFGQRICSDEFQMVRRRRRSSAPSNSIIIPSPLPHHTSLLHAAIAHCNESASSFSFSLN